MAVWQRLVTPSVVRGPHGPARRGCRPRTSHGRRVRPLRRRHRGPGRGRTTVPCRRCPGRRRAPGRAGTTAARRTGHRPSPDDTGRQANRHPVRAGPSLEGHRVHPRRHCRARPWPCCRTTIGTPRSIVPTSRGRARCRRTATCYRVYLRFYMKKVITVVVNSEHEARFSSAGSGSRAEPHPQPAHRRGRRPGHAG